MDYTLSVSESGVLRGKPDFTPARRYSFLVGKGENTHTAQERLLDILQREDRTPTLDELQQAFSVEKVTDDFYQEYEKVFKQIEAGIGGIKGDKRLFTQRLFNRLFFIRFLEKKKWLRYQGSYDYMESLFADAKAGGENFYNDRLRVLFFNGLGRNTDHAPDSPEAQRLIKIRGEVPFLNGGLFEQEDDDDRSEFVATENTAFDFVFEKLFRVYNFTVEEGTSVDVDVAVDPEMLGKIFEELVTGRHDTGSYYTPKPIVAFMCREALKGYLQTAADGESAEAIGAFIDRHDPGGIRDAERVLDALRNVKVCDPACGSGAYLLGMLHELLDLRSILLFSRKSDDATLYEKKLEIIQKNLYGVDIDPFAVNIARLRLWLSLIVEDSRNPLDNPDLDVSLPNLDFKIEIGDSVRTPQPSTWQTADIFRYSAVQEFAKVKAEYMRSHGERKSQLKDALARTREEIVRATGRDCASDFDWQVEFAEVFLPKEAIATIGGALNLGQELAEMPEPGGFDIVLANPPYVRQELLRDIKPDLKKTYGALFCGTADLYVYFYIRALQLLKPGGMLAFISSNKWFRANYGANLRKHVAETCAVRSITDFGELPVFQNAATFPMIFVARKGTLPDAPAVFTQVKTLDPPYPDVPALIAAEGQSLPESAFAGMNWTLAGSDTGELLKKMDASGHPLGEYVGGRIYRGVVTGFNQAFYIEEQTRLSLIAADPRNAEIIKPLAVGDQVRRWCIQRDRWFIVTRIGIDMLRYPTILERFGQWREKMEKRWDKGDHWWELRSCAYYDKFEATKIVYPDICKEPRFTLDECGHYLDATATCIATADLYLLGLLNSKAVWDYIRAKCAVLGDADNGGRVRLKTFYVEQIPIPDASSSDRAAIEALVRKCLDARGVGCEVWEKEIDDRVAGLYGL
ncbi:MAG: Eco57I restriction-modification methylase domain-containing protein [Armatimonadetes bacterium]|nr:Eco57I restriction-modification methylase domain-containing protein [Armatimonadota bacterium]